MIAFYCWFCLLLVLPSESSKVSPKLDFESTDKITATDESSPKIQGVRVVVDTAHSRKSIESGSSEEEPQFTLPKKNAKKIVGIRTDVTIEIGDDDKNSTTTGTKQKVVESDEEVPVFKGYGNGHQPNDYGSNRPWDMVNIPVFHATDDETHGEIHGGGEWVYFRPIGVWTTERNNYLSNRETQRRYKDDLNRRVPQKPCFCANDKVGFRSNPTYDRRSFVPTRKVVTIDDKLERTFRDEDKPKK